MHVVFNRQECDFVARDRVVSSINADNHFDCFSVDFGVSVEVSISTEFFNEVDSRLQAFSGARDSEVLRANSDSDPVSCGCREFSGQP